MSEMRSLRDLYAYNAWANLQVFSLCRKVEPAHLETPAPGTSGTITETLAHLVGVEVVYLMMLRGETLNREGLREQAAGVSLDAWSRRAARLGEEYRDLLASADSGFYDEELPVPWFDFALTKHDGLLQVLSHSAQHRAQVLSALGSRGVEVPDVDYVLFVESTRSAAGQ